MYEQSFIREGAGFLKNHEREGGFGKNLFAGGWSAGMERFTAITKNLRKLRNTIIFVCVSNKNLYMC